MASQIKTGATISYLTVFLSFGLGLLYTPWMVHQIGVADFGLLSLITAFMSYFMLDLGLGQAVARFVSIAVAENNKNKIDCIISSALRIYLIIDTIIFILLVVSFLFINDIFVKLTSEELEKFKVIFCISGFFSILSFPMMPLSGVMMAHERFVPLKTCEMIQKLLNAFLTIALLCSGGGLYGLVILQGAIGVGVGVYKLIYIRYKIGVNISFFNFDNDIVKALFGFSVWICIILICQRLVVNLCPTILGIRASTTAISIFAIGSTMEGYVWHFSQALNGLFLPRVANLTVKDKGKSEISALLIKVGRFQFIIVGLLISGFCVLGQSFIVLWMGDSFSDSYYVAILMISTGIITLTESIAETLLYVENEVKYRAVIFSVSAITSCILSYILAGSIGAIGCAIAIFTSNLLCGVIGMNMVYSKILGLDIKAFFSKTHIKLFLPLGISLFIGFGLCRIIPTDNWQNLVLVGCLYTVIYYTSFWFCGLNIYEKDVIKSLLKIKK